MLQVVVTDLPDTSTMHSATALLSSSATSHAERISGTWTIRVKTLSPNRESTPPSGTLPSSARAISAMSVSVAPMPMVSFSTLKLSSSR